MSQFIQQDNAGDGIDRRGFLKCMAWVGTGMLWSSRGGILSSRVLAQEPRGMKTPAMPAVAGGSMMTPTAPAADFSFVQISDTHLGFNKEPNKDVIATFQRAIERINALAVRPELLLHTGDLTHLSRPEEFDAVEQILKSAKVGRSFFVPGEHDVLADEGPKRYLERFGAQTRGGGWQSFDHRGVHFIGLVNVLDLKPGGLGALGREQLEWLARDVASLGSSTPIVVFAHVPLWTIYPQWGWGTEDSEQALSLLRRFGSVTVLNGHIHQTLQKTEGNVTFHTARSLAFPQPAPGTAPSPGPIKNFPAEKLRSALGLTRVDYVQHDAHLAIVDQTLE